MSKSICMYSRVQAIQNRQARSVPKPINTIPRSPTVVHNGMSHKEMWLAAKAAKKEWRLS